jgi:hypothetical protein
VQLSVTGTELEGVQEQGVVMQSQGVEDVEFSLSHGFYVSKRVLVPHSSLESMTTYFLRLHQGISYQAPQSLFKPLLLFVERRLARIVE